VSRSHFGSSHLNSRFIALPLLLSSLAMMFVRLVSLAAVVVSAAGNPSLRGESKAAEASTFERLEEGSTERAMDKHGDEQGASMQEEEEKALEKAVAEEAVAEANRATAEESAEEEAPEEEDTEAMEEDTEGDGGEEEEGQSASVGGACEGQDCTRQTR